MHLFWILTSLTLISASKTSHVDPNPQIQSSSPALLTLNFPPTSALPNPQSLPARTYATLSTANQTLTAYFRRDSTFIFQDVPVGSYLGEIWTGAAGVNTVPMRVDVEMASTGRSEGDGKGAALTKRIGVWQTFRANEWDNKGEALGEASAEEGLRIDVQVLGVRDVYEQRGGFSPMSLLKNPMILLGIVAMGLMFGMPKLMENMDPEMREEFEKQQRTSGLTNALTGQGSGGFDAASWLAGSASKDTNIEPVSKVGVTGKSSGVENKGGKKRRG